VAEKEIRHMGNIAWEPNPHGKGWVGGDFVVAESWKKWWRAWQDHDGVKTQLPQVFASDEEAKAYCEAIS